MYMYIILHTFEYELTEYELTEYDSIHFDRLGKYFSTSYPIVRLNRVRLNRIIYNGLDRRKFPLLETSTSYPRVRLNRVLLYFHNMRIVNSAWDLFLPQSHILLSIYRKKYSI